MRLIERLKIQREALAKYRESIESGKSPEESADDVADALHEKYGASVDWAKIIEIIMMLLALFSK